MPVFNFIKKMFKFMLVNKKNTLLNGQIYKKTLKKILLSGKITIRSKIFGQNSWVVI